MVGAIPTPSDPDPATEPERQSSPDRQGERGLAGLRARVQPSPAEPHGHHRQPQPAALDRVHRVTDGETGIPVPLAYSKAKGYRFGEIHRRPETLRLRKHDFRLLVVE